MKNRLCEVLGVRYPIIQGGMAWSCGKPIPFRYLPQEEFLTAELWLRLC